MRTELEVIKDVRAEFIATFVRYGKKSAYKGPMLTTLLFRNVKYRDGNIVCSHIWFTQTKGFRAFDFKEGDQIKFQARVKEYTKGYKGYRDDVDKPIEIDYRLSHPTNIQRLYPIALR